MTNGLLGKKLGMTQIYDESVLGASVTVIEAGPCRVVAIKIKERRLRSRSAGYHSVKEGVQARWVNWDI